MNPDAHLFIHRSEQTARARTHLRDGDRPPRASHRRSFGVRALFSRRAIKGRQLREA